MTANVMKKCEKAIEQKAAQMVSSIVESNAKKILEKLKTVCDEADAGAGVVPVDIRLTIKYEDGAFILKAGLKCDPKRIPVADALPEVRIDPKQPELDGLAEE